MVIPDGKRAAVDRTGTGPEPPSAGSSPLEPQPGGGTEEKMEQSVCGAATESEEANTESSAAGNPGVHLYFT